MNVPNVTLLLLLFKAHLVISVIRFSPYDIVIVTDVIVLTQPREPVLQLSTALKTDHEIYKTLKQNKVSTKEIEKGWCDEDVWKARETVMSS